MKSTISGSTRELVSFLVHRHQLTSSSDMETRKSTRDAAWSVGSWSDTVQEVGLRLEQNLSKLKLRRLSS
jgi:hypothetical protein